MKNFYIVLVVITLFALWPFFKKGYFETHDGTWMIIRSTAFHQALSSGQFPVRFVDRLNSNYGYPVLNFVYPLPFYLLEIPIILKFSYETSFKALFVISSLFSTVLMFWALSQRFSKLASLSGAVLYFYTPYRFLDLYVRGSIGESVSFAIIPLVLGCIFKISNGNKLFLPLLSISVALLILSHNVLAILFLPIFLLVSFLITGKGKLKVFTAFAIGLLVSLYFWLPAIYDLRYVDSERIKTPDITSQLANITDLIFPRWGYGPAIDTADGLSIQLGILSFFVVIGALLTRFKSKASTKLIDLLLIIFLVSALLMTNKALFFWKNMPYVDIVQFPWRLLSVTTFISAFLASHLVDAVRKKKLIGLLIIVSSILLTFSYTTPKAFIQNNDGYYATNEDTTAIRDEYLPIWVKNKQEVRAHEKLIVGEDTQITEQQIRPNNYKALIKTQNDTLVTVNTVYFPGHFAKVDGNTVKINYDNEYGLIRVPLLKGKHEVIIKYGRTPVHLASEILSLLALIGTGSYLLFLWKKQNS